MPVYVLVDGMGPSDRISFAGGNAEPSDLLRATASMAYGEHITRTADGRVNIEENV